MKKLDVVCIGEILWDSMPLGLFLGGAPFNVAYHMNKLGANVHFVSCVGDDDLGHEAIKRTAIHGMSTDLIQVNYKYKTGFVDVDLGAKGIPFYDIKKPAAWDFITQTNELYEAMENADVIVFGTLAQRMETSRKTINSLKKCSALKVLDLNLRVPFDDNVIVQSSLEMADFLKVNIDELDQLKNWFNLPSENEEAVSELARKFEFKGVTITLGGDGAVFFDGSKWVENEGEQITAVDTVGAGDAFLAALITGYMKKLPSAECLKLANKLGAFVATCYGGTPDYVIQNFTEIDSLQKNESAVA